MIWFINQKNMEFYAHTRKQFYECNLWFIMNDLENNGGNLISYKPSYNKEMFRIHYCQEQ